MECFKKRRINKDIVLLGNRAACMPIDIFSLSRRIADLRDSRYIDSLIVQFGSHENTFVRRCLLTAIRFLEQNCTETMSDYLSSSLRDQSNWVQYDAAFIIKTLGLAKDGDFDRLGEIAGEYAHDGSDELDAIKPSSSAEYAKKMAAQALCARRRP